MTSSKSTPDEPKQAKSTHSTIRIIDFEEDNESLSVGIDKIELGPFGYEEFVEQERFLDAVDSFMPVSINKSNLTLQPVSSDFTSNLQTIILNTKRRKLELLQARMKSSRREEQEAEVYQQRQIE